VYSCSHEVPIIEKNPEILEQPSQRIVDAYVGTTDLPKFYFPPIPPPCIIAWFCSANRWPSLSLVLRNLSTHRLTHVSSLVETALEVKSLMQSSKHLYAQLGQEWNTCTANQTRDGCFRGKRVNGPLNQVGVHLNEGQPVSKYTRQDQSTEQWRRSVQSSEIAPSWSPSSVFARRYSGTRAVRKLKGYGRKADQQEANGQFSQGKWSSRIHCCCLLVMCCRNAWLRRNE
jgi:hypothetical protein